MGLLIGQGSLVSVVFLALGAVGPWFYLGFRRRAAARSSTRPPDTLQLMSGSLAAGLSLAQSIDTIVREGTEPVAAGVQAGAGRDPAGRAARGGAGGVAERFDSKDFEWVVMAINIQREVGGNLAELLDTVAATMREREYLRRQVPRSRPRAAVGDGALGAAAGFLLYLLLGQRDYVCRSSPTSWPR